MARVLTLLTIQSQIFSDWYQWILGCKGTGHSCQDSKFCRKRYGQLMMINIHPWFQYADLAAAILALCVLFFLGNDWYYFFSFISLSSFWIVCWISWSNSKLECKDYLFSYSFIGREMCGLLLINFMFVLLHNVQYGFERRIKSKGVVQICCQSVFLKSWYTCTGSL